MFYMPNICSCSVPLKLPAEQPEKVEAWLIDSTGLAYSQALKYTKLRKSSGFNPSI